MNIVTAGYSRSTESISGRQHRSREQEQLLPEDDVYYIGEEPDVLCGHVFRPHRAHSRSVGFLDRSWSELLITIAGPCLVMVIGMCLNVTCGQDQLFGILAACVRYIDLISDVPDLISLLVLRVAAFLMNCHIHSMLSKRQPAAISLPLAIRGRFAWFLIGFKSGSGLGPMPG